MRSVVKNRQRGSTGSSGEVRVVVGDAEVALGVVELGLVGGVLDVVLVDVPVDVLLDGTELVVAATVSGAGTPDVLHAARRRADPARATATRFLTPRPQAPRRSGRPRTGLRRRSAPCRCSRGELCQPGSGRGPTRGAHVRDGARR